MQTYLIDALNLIYKSSELKKSLGRGLDIAVEALLIKFNSIAENNKTNKYVIFVDGKEFKFFTVLRSNVEIKFSGSGRAADLLIKDMIHGNTKKKLLTVISSDREIYNYAKIYANEALLSEDFIKKIKPKYSNKYSGFQKETNKKEKPQGVSKKEINRMLALFQQAEDIDK